MPMSVSMRAATSASGALNGSMSQRTGKPKPIARFGSRRSRSCRPPAHTHLRSTQLADEDVVERSSSLCTVGLDLGVRLALDSASTHAIPAVSGGSAPTRGSSPTSPRPARRASTRSNPDSPSWPPHNAVAALKSRPANATPPSAPGSAPETTIASGLVADRILASIANYCTPIRTRRRPLRDGRTKQPPLELVIPTRTYSEPPCGRR